MQHAVPKARRHGLWRLIRDGRFVAGEWRNVYLPYYCEPSIGYVINQVVCRYMRIHGLTRVGDYNRLCAYIARTFSGNPSSTMRSIEKRGRDKSPLRIVERWKDLYAEPVWGFSEQEVRERLRRIIHAREYRLSRQCTQCGSMHNVTYRPTKRFPKIAAFAGMNKGHLGFDRLCMPCWNRRRGIEKRAAQVAELQSSINEAKRKLTHDCTR